MKKLLIFLIIFSSCHSDELEDNQILQNEIDKMGYSECWLALEIDSLDNIIDTIDIVRKKFNREEKLLFKRREYKYENQEYFTETYYWEDGKDFLIRRKFGSEDFKTYTEVFRNKNKEPKKVMIFEGFGERKEISRMDYKYDYSIFGRKKRLTLDAILKGGKVLHVLDYNQDEKAEMEFTIIGLDTVSTKKYFYENQNLVKTEDLKTTLDTLLTIDYFSEPEKNDSTLYFSVNDGIRKIESRIIFKFDENSKYRGSEEVNFETGEKKKTIVEKISCD